MLTINLIATLLKINKKSLYNYPGGTVAPIFHECKKVGVPLLCTKTEQGAGYMAIADAIVSRTPSFVAVTSGPGATNLITCIADAFYDSIPLIAFTGQVGTKDLSRPEVLRQRGFQEVPIVDMVRKVTKAAMQPRTPQELADVLVQAMNLAQEGRPGPVLIDLPMDMQMNPLPDGLMETMVEKLAASSPSLTTAPIAPKVIGEIRKTLAAASRPIILAGGGAIDASEELRNFARRHGIPVLTSMRGLGTFPTNDPLFAGWVGHTGLPWANWALSQADWVLVLGSRLDVNNILVRAGWELVGQLEQPDYNGYRILAKPAKTNTQVNVSPEDNITLKHLLKHRCDSIDNANANLKAISNAEKIVVWGGGMHTEFLYHLTDVFVGRSNRQFFIVDSDPLKKGKSWRGIKIEAPERIREIDWSSAKLLISSYGGQEKIAECASRIGVPTSVMIKAYDTLRVY
jgi:thiamine pyrophosphate-dependent acetolactate synthase large subunit-like protein